MSLNFKKKRNPQSEIKDFACVEQNTLIKPKIFFSFISGIKVVPFSMKHFSQAPVFGVSHQTRPEQPFSTPVSQRGGVVRAVPRLGMTQRDPGLAAFCPAVPFSGHCHLWLVSPCHAAGIGLLFLQEKAAMRLSVLPVPPQRIPSSLGVAPLFSSHHARCPM